MNPSAEEIRTVAEALADSDQKARRDPVIKRILAGQADHELVMTSLRQHVQRVIADRDSTKVTQRNRTLLLEFAASYGTPRMGARKAPDGAPMSSRVSVRMTENHHDLIERAAAKAGVSVVDFMRDAAVLAARNGLGTE